MSTTHRFRPAVSQKNRTPTAVPPVLLKGLESFERPRLVQRLRSESGAATAEYAVAMMAAVSFAGLLVVIMRGNEVKGILTDLVRQALSING